MIKKWFALLVLSLLSLNAYSDTGITGGLNFDPPDTDASIYYLELLFGFVEGSLQGTSGLIGMMFRVFNSGVLAVGGVILLYILFTSVLNTAHTGEMLGKKWSSVWIPIRSSMGVALLVPQASGYSFIQTFIMWLVVQGVGLADSIWNQALGYLDNRALLSVPKTAGNVGGLGTGPIQNVAKQFGRIAVCVADLEAQLKAENTKRYEDELAEYNQDVLRYNQGELTVRPLAPVQSYVPSLMDTVSFEPGTHEDKVIEFPGKMTGAHDHLTHLTGRCGKFLLKSKQINNSQVAAGRDAALENLFYQIGSVAQEFIDNLVAKRRNATDPLTEQEIIDVIDQMDNGVMVPFLMQFMGVISSLSTQMSTESGKGSLNDKWQQQAKKYGWITAANAFFRWASAATETVGASANLLRIMANPGSRGTCKEGGMGYMLNCLFQQKDVLSVVLSEAKTSPPIKGAVVELPKDPFEVMLKQDNDLFNHHFLNNAEYSGGGQAAGPNAEVTSLIVALVLGLLGGVAIAGGIFGWIGALLILPGAIKVGVGMGHLFVPNIGAFSGVHPIVWCAVVGHGMIDMGITFWAAATYVIFTMAVGMSMGACANPLPYAIQAMTTWTSPMIAVLVTALCAGGAGLAYYIPLIPFFVFLFAVVGWFFAVVEAMVAGPLVALGIVHPEGHEAFGKAEPAVTLMLNVFLRPSMILIGFIAAAILSYIAIMMLNLGFAAAFNDAVFKNPAVYLGVGFFFAFPMVIAIYMMLLSSLLSKIFSLTSVVPDKVMQWIGGGAAGGGGAADLAQLEGKVKGVGSGIASGGTALFRGENKGVKPEAEGDVSTNKPSDGGQGTQAPAQTTEDPNTAPPPPSTSVQGNAGGSAPAPGGGTGSGGGAGSGGAPAPGGGTGSGGGGSTQVGGSNDSDPTPPGGPAGTGGGGEDQ